MSVIQPDVEGPRSPGLMLNLSSNNPFRNRTASPTLSPQNPPPRPVSRNPFLDASGAPISTSPTMSQANSTTTAPRAPLTGNAADLFDNLTLNDKPNPTVNGMRSPPPPPPYSSVNKDEVTQARSENIPPRGPAMHRPTRSQEEAMRARRAATGLPGRARAPNGELNIFADPESPRKSRERRARRNSDSSITDRNGKPLDPEEEKRRQERHRRERRQREGDAGRPKFRKGKLDIIDQLDATSIYGTGLFHHDGPFDACNPHRNRPNSKRAPMEAFPKDSLNNIIGGGGPLNARPDHATFLGHNDDEAFKDYARGGAGPSSYESYGNGAVRSGKPSEPIVLSAVQRVEPVHGDESLGLGTSTFLEGAPASRNAIQRRQTEESIMPDAAGLQRKKSLAQKIRGISNNRRDIGPSGRVTSPDGAYPATSPELPTPSSRGGNEKNPFFREFEGKEEKIDVKRPMSKDENITLSESEAKNGRPRAPSSPKRGFGGPLERRATSDGMGEEQPRTGGFLSRVKSLKGKNKRPERPEKPA